MLIFPCNGLWVICLGSCWPVPVVLDSLHVHSDNLSMVLSEQVDWRSKHLILISPALKGLYTSKLSMCWSALLVCCQLLYTWAWNSAGRVLYWLGSGKKQKVFVIGVTNLEYTTNTRLISFESFELNQFMVMEPPTVPHLLFASWYVFIWESYSVNAFSVLNWIVMLVHFLVVSLKRKATNHLDCLECISI